MPRTHYGGTYQIRSDRPIVGKLAQVRLDQKGRALIVVEQAQEGGAELLSSSEVYDDVISALRNQGVGLIQTRDLLRI